MRRAFYTWSPELPYLGKPEELIDEYSNLLCFLYNTQVISYKDHGEISDTKDSDGRDLANVLQKYHNELK